MTLNYDFDVISSLPADYFANETRPKQSEKTNANEKPVGDHIVLFRDIRTVKALEAAPENIRKIFNDSRFGLNQSYIGAPDGCYLEKDREFRTVVFKELEANLKSQLTYEELKEILVAKQTEPKQKSLEFLNRLNDKLDAKQSAQKLAAAQNAKIEEFDVAQFIQAATTATGVEIPEEAGVGPNTNPGLISQSDAEFDLRVFTLALIPRLIFLGSMFVIGMTLFTDIL